MAESRSPSTRIGEPENDRERSAARALFRHNDAGIAVHDARKDSSRPFVFEPDVLIAAWNGSRPGVVAGFRVAPDGTAFIWPPRDAGQGSASASAVMSSLVERLESTRYHTALAVIEQDRHDQHCLLERAGFIPTGAIAELRYLLNRDGSTISDPQRVAVNHGIHWSGFDSSNKARFESLIDRCLAKTEVPARYSQPTGRELLASFAARDDFRASNWWLIGRDGRDVAVMLVNGDERTREIVFLGVIPDARRQGIGTMALDFVLKTARNDCCQSVDLTAEINNAAAMSLYVKSGFRVTATRLGFVRRRRE